MSLHSPWVLLLLLVLPLQAYLSVRKKSSATVKFSSLDSIRPCHASWRLKLRPLLVVTKMAALTLLIIAMARPQQKTVLSEVSTEGIAMEVVVDHSGSMETEMDYYSRKLNRLDVVKKVLNDFISGDKKSLGGRGGDLIGLVTFARFADTTCPLVLGHNVLLEFLKQTDIVKIESENATAIGDAVTLAAARLKKAEQELHQRKIRLGLGGENPRQNEKEPDFKIKSKIILLLTDGRNNACEFDPIQAAKLAKQWGIRIYTIGIGSANAYTTIRTMMGSFKVPSQQDLDEGLLKRIADETGGFYARADDAKMLTEVVKKIDNLEKSQVKSVQYAQYSENFEWWALAGLILLAFEMLAGCTVFRKIP